MAGVVAASAVWWWTSALEDARQTVVDKLAELNGAPVRVAEMQIASDGIELEDVELLEEAGGQPWLRVGRLRIVVPPSEALERERFDALVLEDLVVTLGFDEQGRWLRKSKPPPDVWRLPADKVEIRNATVLIRQKGKPEVRAGDVRLTLTEQQGAIQLAGEVGDLFEQKWPTRGSYVPATSKLDWSLQTDALPLTSEFVASLPFVPSKQLEPVRFEGRTSVQANVSNAADEPFAFRLELQPELTRLAFADSGLQFEGVTGDATLTRHAFRFQNAQTHYRDGRLTSSGTIDFTESPSKATVSYELEDAALDQFTTLAARLRPLRGRLHAQGDVSIAMPSGSWELRSESAWRVDQGRYEKLALDAFQGTLSLAPVVFGRDGEGLSLAGRVDGSAAIAEAPLPALLTAVSALRPAASRDEPMELPDLPAATASGTLQFSLPLGEARADSPLAVTADVHSERIPFDSLVLEQLKSKWKIADGRLTFEISSDVEDGGSLQASGTLESEPVPHVSAALELRKLAARTIADQLLPPPSDGTISRPQGDLDADLQLEIPLADWQSRGDWRIRGRIASPTLEWFDQPLLDAEAEFDWSDRQLAVELLQFRWKDLPVEASGQIQMKGANPFQLTFHVPESAWPTSYPLPVREGSSPNVRLEGTLEGSLSPLRWHGRGDGSLTSVQIHTEGAGESLRFPRIPFTWEADPTRFAAHTGDVPAWGGMLAVDVEQQLTGARSSHATIRLDEADARQLAAQFFPDMPAAITAGHVSGKLESPDLNDWRQAELVLRTDDMAAAVRGVEFTRVEADAAYRDQRLNYRLWADTLGGEIAWQGDTQAETDGPGWNEFPGQLDVRGLRLERVIERIASQPPGPTDGPPARATRLTGVRGRVRGRFDLVVRTEAPGTTGAGQIELRNLAWESQPLRAPLSAEVLVTEQLVRVDNLRTQWGRAQIDGQLELPRAANRPGAFALNISQLPLQTAVARWPQLQRQMRGLLDVRVRGRIHGDLWSASERPPAWNGTAVVSLRDARYQGVDVGASGALIDWTVDPSRRTYRFELRRSELRLADGRVQAEGRLESRRGGIDVRAEGQLSRVRIGSLLQASPQLRNRASGELRGRFEVQGRSMRSIDDLVASFDGELRQAQTFQLPVLQDLGRFLNIGSLAQSPADSTALEAHLRRSVVHIDRLTVAADAAQLVVQGEVTLRGRLDLDVTAHTGRWVSQPLLARLFQSSLLVAQPVPAGVLLQANQFFADRLIFLHVGGTLRSPIIQLRAAPQLQQETVRFFVQQAARTLLPTASPAPQP